LEPDEVYLAGLLHDLGRFILYLEAPESVRDVEESAWETPQELIDAEMRVCGFDHAQLGYLAAIQWRLPQRLANVIRSHHAPQALNTDSTERGIVTAVRIADWLAVRLAKAENWRTLSATELRELVSIPQCGPEAWTLEVLAAMRLALDRSAVHAELLGLGRPPQAERGRDSHV
jgi:HD-like signal output (HDOD) protein